MFAVGLACTGRTELLPVFGEFIKNNTKKSSALVCKVIVMLLELFYICTIYGRMHCLL